MSYKILVIGDPVPELKPGKETTLALIFEAQRRDYAVDYCTSRELCLTNGRVMGLVRPMTLKEDLNDHIHLGEETLKNLKNYDMILLRSNPDGYKRMNTSYILDALVDDVFITNDPRGIRELHGKYFISNFPDFIVPYAFIEHPAHLENFFDTHADIVLKPVNGFGGAGIRRIKEKPQDVQKLFDSVYEEFGHSPFIAQEYIPAAAKGDKRIIMFGGAPVCSILRVPKDEDSLANISQGATVKPCELTLREQALCREIGPILRDYGLFFAGIDMLGDYLTELNVISVGTIIPANQVYGFRLEEKFWDMLIRDYEDFKNAA